MDGVKKLAGVYMVGLAVVVAAYFAINPLLLDAIDVPAVWSVLDILMAIGLALALVFNYAAKREESGRDPEGAITRHYLDVNVAFYLTAAVAILFLHNWFSLLAQGPDSLDGNDTAWIIWAVVGVLVPMVGAVTSRSLWKEAVED